MEDLLASRLAYALTGAQLTLPDVPPSDLLPALRRHGWDENEIHRHARACRERGEAWPHPVPTGWLREAGAARWAALLSAAVSSLGPAEAPTVRPARRPLTADERRLLAEVPPHHGD